MFSKPLLIFMLTLFSLILFYCFSILPRRSMRRQMEKYHQTMFAHRGYHCAPKGIPENSMSSFRAAIEHHYGIELDLHLTRDGHLVVFHDHTLDRICHCPGTIELLSLEQLKKCRLSGTSEQIPLFQDVLTLVNGRVPLLIELKIPGYSLKICKKTYDLLRTYKVIISYSLFTPSVFGGFAYMHRRFCADSFLPDLQRNN